MSQPIESGLEVDTSRLAQEREQKQPFIEHSANAPELRAQQADKYVITPEPIKTPERKSFFQRHKLLIIILGGILLIGAIVGGAVGGTLGSRKSSSSASSQPDTSNNSTSQNSTAGVLPAVAGKNSVCRGGICSPAVAALSIPTGQRLIAGLASNKSVIALTGTGSNNDQWDTTWRDLGISAIAAPAVVPSRSGWINVFAVQPDQSLYQIQYANGVWQSSWTQLGGNWTGPVTAIKPISDNDDFFLLYGLAPNGSLQEYWWDRRHNVKDLGGNLLG